MTIPFDPPVEVDGAAWIALSVSDGATGHSEGGPFEVYGKSYQWPQKVCGWAR